MRRITINALLSGILMLSLTTCLTAQTPIKAPTNKHDITTDLKIGEMVKAKIHPRLPIVRDVRIADYLQVLSSLLERGMPSEFRYDSFKYTFHIVDFSGIAVFAIPGGTIYISRGVVEKARGEGELLGMMAHGISHVALRHYTARLPEAEKIDWELLEFGILNTFVEGRPGYIDYSGFRKRSDPYKIRFNDDLERQADILAAQIMSRVHFSPISLGNVYSHIGFDGLDTGYCPSKSDTRMRKEMLYREASLLQLAGVYDPKKDVFMSNDFQPIQKLVTEMPRQKRDFIFQK
jgi:predicted Zn-dependent protease